MLKIAKLLPMKTFALSAAVTFAGTAMLFSAPAHSWGSVGHEYIGEATYAYLTPQARAWVDAHLQRVDEASLATATTWADRVRGTPEGDAMGPLHFANIPPHANEFDMDRDCPQRRCVVGATFDALDVLFDPNADKQAQAEQLRKLTHWVSDLHQPLHLGFAEDRGGNDTVVLFKEQEHNLHRIWDTLIVREQDLLSPAELAAEQPLPAQPRSLQKDDWYQRVEKWATESNKLARESAYMDITAGEPLSEPYLDEARQVIEQQLIVSAQRMAQLLNAAAAANGKRD